MPPIPNIINKILNKNKRNLDKYYKHNKDISKDPTHPDIEEQHIDIRPVPF